MFQPPVKYDWMPEHTINTSGSKVCGLSMYLHRGITTVNTIPITYLLFIVIIPMRKVVIDLELK